MLKAIIFDMDGVLINSVWGIRKSFVKVFEEYGIDTEQFKTLHKEKYEGRTLSEQLQMRKEDLNIQQTLDPITFSRKAFQYQLELEKDKYIPNPNILQLIQEAKNKGIKIAVATSSAKERAITLFTLVGIYDKLDAFVSCEEVIKGKPDPESFLKTANLLNISPENCVVIEDAMNGIQAAKSAGMKAIAKVKPERISEWFDQADLCFEDFKELFLSDIEKLFIT